MKRPIWDPGPDCQSVSVWCCSQKEIYDIGTEILYFQRFVNTDMFLFSVSIILEDLESFRRDLAFGCVKTRFKATLKNIKCWAWIRLWAFVMVVFQPK